MSGENKQLTYQKGLIKSLIAEPKALTDVVRIVDENDFGENNYKLVYKAMLQLNRSQKHITLPDIAEQIMNDSPEVSINATWILNLDDDLTDWTVKASAKTWAKLLKRESSNLRIKQIAKDAIQKADNSDPLLLIQNVQDKLTKVSLDNIVDDTGTREQKINDYLEYMKSRHNDEDRTIPSMYPSVDKYTIGWLPQQLITIGARTSVGKTVFAGNCAVAAAAAGKSVLMFSLEMSRNELYDRLISSLSMVSLNDLRKGDLEGEEKENFDNAIETLRNDTIDIDETANVTVDYIRSKSLKKAQSVDGLDLIIIDYLQLINNPNSRNGSRQESVAEISRQMKVLAKQLNIPIMILVQLNRESKDDAPDALPKLSDIRESGAIAQDSDIVILIHRKLDDESVDPKALFIIAKNRNGQVGKKISVRAKMQYATFEDKQNSYEDGEVPPTPPEDEPEDDGDVFSDDSENPDPLGDIPDNFKEGNF